MKTNRISRRNFIQKTAITSGAASLVSFGLAGNSFAAEPVADKSSREIWIAGISQMDLTAETPELMAGKVYDMFQTS
jgi:beta-ureidopropionase